MDLIELFAQPPASFVWSTSENGRRTMGTSEGFVLDIWPDRVEAAALFPPDRPDLAQRNATLMQLLLIVLQPDWAFASSWLAHAMRGHREVHNVSRRVRFQHDAAHSRVTLRIAR